MSRNLITKPATLARLSAIIGQTVVRALARGGTDHRIDCVLEDRSIVHLFRDGTFQASEYKAAESVMRPQPHAAT